MKFSEIANTVLSFTCFICSYQDIFSPSVINFTHKNSKDPCYFSFSLSKYMIRKRVPTLNKKIIEEIKMFGTKWWWYLHNTVNVLMLQLHIFSLNGEFYVNFTWQNENQLIKGLIIWTMCWAHGKEELKIALLYHLLSKLVCVF